MGRNQVVILLYLHLPHPSMQSLSHKAPLQMSPLEPSDGSMVVHCSHLSADVSEDVAKIKYFLCHNRVKIKKIITEEEAGQLHFLEWSGERISSQSRMVFERSNSEFFRKFCRQDSRWGNLLAKKSWPILIFFSDTSTVLKILFLFSIIFKILCAADPYRRGTVWFWSGIVLSCKINDQKFGKSMFGKL